MASLVASTALVAMAPPVPWSSLSMVPLSVPYLVPPSDPDGTTHLDLYLPLSDLYLAGRLPGLTGCLGSPGLESDSELAATEYLAATWQSAIPRSVPPGHAPSMAVNGRDAASDRSKSSPTPAAPHAPHPKAVAVSLVSSGPLPHVPCTGSTPLSQYHTAPPLVPQRIIARVPH